MRKHVCIVSEESVFAGRYHCGIGEVADTLAIALRNYYDVTLITIGKRAGGVVGGTITLGVEGDDFTRQAAAYINTIKPDLVHNLDGDPALIDLLEVDCPTVYTFDYWEECMDKRSALQRYTHVTTVSMAYAAEVNAAYPDAAALGVVGITNGIDGGLYPHSPSIWGRTPFLSALHKEDTGMPIMVSMGRLTADKGIQDIIDAAPAIAAAGVLLVVWGTGDTDLEEQLQALHDAGTLIYYHRMADYFQMMSALHGADYYLMPSVREACGLQALKAAKLGCVPIVRPIGGLQDTFDASNAILITSTLQEAADRAVALSEAERAALRSACMETPVTWDTRVQAWVELYGLPTAPVSESELPHKSEDTASYAEEPSTPHTIPACPFAAKREG